MEIQEPQRQRNIISLTPLIDVVFILLIFFMLVSSFVEWRYFELGVGKSDSYQIDHNQQSFIKVDFNNEYSLNGKQTSLEEIKSIIRENIRLNFDHPVLIQPVKDLPLQNLINVIDAISEIAGQNISLVQGDSFQ